MLMDGSCWYAGSMVYNAMLRVVAMDDDMMIMYTMLEGGYAWV